MSFEEQNTQNLDPSDSLKIRFINSPFSKVYDRSKEKVVKKIEVPSIYFSISPQNLHKK